MTQKFIFAKKSKKHRIPDPGSRIRIRNTGDFWFALAVGGTVGYWLSLGAAVLATHLIDQSQKLLCAKKFSVYFISTQSPQFLPFLKLWFPAFSFSVIVILDCQSFDQKHEHANFFFLSKICKTELPFQLNMPNVLGEKEITSNKNQGNFFSYGAPGAPYAKYVSLLQ